jgi:DMSO/TMAO reductase YedYZ molybdopterin-dependent catalytic subunit
MRPIIHNKNAMRDHVRFLKFGSVVFTTLLLFCGTLLSAQTAVPEFKLVVTGDVPTPLSLNAADLAAMPRESVEMPDPDGGKTTYEGVPLQEILKKAGIPFGRQMRGKDLAGYVLASAKDDYQVVFSLGELDPDLGGVRAIVADKRDGKPLFQYQGPFRLVLPGDKAGARSVRMLEKLEVVKLRK